MVLLQNKWKIVRFANHVIFSYLCLGFIYLLIMILTIDDHLLLERNIGEQHFKEQLALFFYQKEFMTVGQSASFCGLSVPTFQDLMQKNKVFLHYDEVDLVQDLGTLDKVLVIKSIKKF
jgi:predicted HTH domain antitoxin